jgi:hypothetical protein
MTLPVFGQGMSPEARQNIHTLLDGHGQIQRDLKLTEYGYVATTQSTNDVIATALQNHVQQMQERLDSGLAVRRWDPAFAEFRAYYEQIEVRVEKTDSGVKVVALGKSPEAVKVAQNHARIINAFVNDGWSAHDAHHAAALSSTNHAVAAPVVKGGCGRGFCSGGMCGGGCRRGSGNQTSK